MTSTNDGKDVKSNQTSGQRGKSYYIELYRSLETHLNGEGPFSDRVRHLCLAWQRVHEICVHSADATHPHLSTWIQRHTARTVLQSEWSKPKSSQDEHTKLEEAIDSFVQECQTAAISRNGDSLPWETQLMARAAWFKSQLPNPWGHNVLTVLLDPRADSPTTEEVLEWLKDETGVVFSARVRQLALSKCEDLALGLVTAVMNRVRACREAVPDTDLMEGRKDTPEPKEETFETILNKEAGFADFWDLLTDIEFCLLLKSDKRTTVIDLAKQLPLANGYLVVERLLNRLETAPREKRLWKNAKEVAILVTQVMITRCMILPTCTLSVRLVLQRCAYALVRAMPPPELAKNTAPLTALARTAQHLYVFATAVHNQQKKVTEELKPFVVELFVRAITSGMNELEKLKLKPEYGEKEARATEYTLSTWFTMLGKLLSGSARVECECALTAFSLHPSAHMYERIKQAPDLPPVQVDPQIPKDEPGTVSEFGSWAGDSRTQTNFVKTSEHLNMKQTQHQSNVLSTAILNEGERLGLDAVLCQDIAVLLSGPRVKTLSWDMDRQVLLDNCRAYMERTCGGTRALTTELKYLNLDPRHYQHLPEEHSDEDDIYYGIEKGYEHLVEPSEEIWENAFFDPDSYSSSNETIAPRRKKKGKLYYSSESDTDPLSLVADKKEKKKERPHSKERSKERKKKTPKDDRNQIEGKDEEQTERRKNEATGKKKEKRERKKREKKEKQEKKVKVENIEQFTSPMKNLIGMKVTREDAANCNVYSTDSDVDTVVYDGQFSMDEMKSPERSVEDANGNVKKCKETLALALQNAHNAFKELTPVKAQGEPARTVVVPRSPLFTNASPVSENSIPNMSRSENSMRDEVKKSITKLLQFRRQKRSESSNSPMSSPTQADRSKVAVAQYGSPRSNLVGTKLSNTSNFTLNKQQYEHLKNLKNEVNLLKSISYPQKNAKKGTCSRVQPFNPACYRKNNVQHNPQVEKAHLLSQSQSDLLNKVSQSDKALNLSQQPATINYDLNQPNTLAKETPPRQPAPRLSQSSSHHNSYEKFLLELKHNANAGINPVDERKQLRPISRVTPVVPNILRTKSEVVQNIVNIVKSEQNLSIPSVSNLGKTENDIIPQTEIKTEPNRINPLHNVVKTESSITPQCAKTVIQPKKAENAPNTFSRLSYIHKNKLNDKKLLENSVKYSDLHNSISDELDRRAAELRSTKMNIIQHKLTHSTNRVSHAAQPKVPPKVEVQKIEDPTTFQTEMNQHQHPLLTSILKSGALTITKPTANNKKTVKIEQPDISYSSKPLNTTHTSLTEKDQQELLQLLGQKNILNRPQQHLKSTYQKKLVDNPQSVSNSAISNNDLLNKRPLNPGSALLKNQPTTATASQNKLPETGQKLQIPIVFDGQSFKFPEITTTTIMKTTAMVQTNKVQKKSNKPKAPENLSDERNKTGLEINKVVSKKYVPKPPIPTPKSDEEIQEQDWTKVLDALRSHKTPSRGPNALNMVFNKDSFEKAIDIHQNINAPLPSKQIRNTTKQSSLPMTATETSLSQSAPTSTINARHVQSQPIPKKVVLDMPTKHKMEFKKLFPYAIHNSTATQQPLQLPCALQKDDPFISGIPNADYEILESLIDDDLRQEIGELSDEENYRTPVVSTSTASKKDTNKGKSVAIISTKKPDAVHNKIIEINPSTPCVPPSQKTKVKPQILSNEKVDITKLPAGLIGSKIIRKMPVIVAPKTRDIKLCNVKNDENDTNAVPTTSSTVILNATPQPPVQNGMVIIDPYGVCNSNQNYVSLNKTTNIVYQQFTAPVATQIIIGNTFIPATVTAPAAAVNVVYNQTIATDVPIVHIPETLFASETAKLTNITIPANVVPHESCQSWKTAGKPIDTNLEISKDRNKVKVDNTFVNKATKPQEVLPESQDKVDLNVTCERKDLSYLQEELDKPNAQQKLAENIDSKTKNQQLSCESDKHEVRKNQERLTKKRLAIINREVNNRCFYPAIPLTYTQLKTFKTNENFEEKQTTSKYESKDITKATSEVAENEKTIFEKTSELTIPFSYTPPKSLETVSNDGTKQATSETKSTGISALEKNKLSENTEVTSKEPTEQVIPHSHTPLSSSQTAANVEETILNSNKRASNTHSVNTEVVTDKSLEAIKSTMNTSKKQKVRLKDTNTSGRLLQEHNKETGQDKQTSTKLVLNDPIEKHDATDNRNSKPVRASQRIRSKKILKDKMKEFESEPAHSDKRTNCAISKKSVQNSAPVEESAKTAATVNEMPAICVPDIEEAIAKTTIQKNELDDKTTTRISRNKLSKVSVKAVIKDANDAIEISSSPEICEHRPFEAPDGEKTLDINKNDNLKENQPKRNNEGKTEEINSKGKLIPSKNQDACASKIKLTNEVGANEQPALPKETVVSKNCDKSVPNKSVSMTEDTITQTTTQQYTTILNKPAENNKLSQLVDDIESALSAITESTISSPILSPLDMEVYEETPIRTQNKIESTKVLLPSIYRKTAAMPVRPSNAEEEVTIDPVQSGKDDSIDVPPLSIALTENNVNEQIESSRDIDDKLPRNNDKKPGGNVEISQIKEQFKAVYENIDKGIMNDQMSKSSSTSYARVDKIENKKADINKPNLDSVQLKTGHSGVKLVLADGRIFSENISGVHEDTVGAKVVEQPIPNQNNPFPKRVTSNSEDNDVILLNSEDEPQQPQRPVVNKIDNNAKISNAIPQDYKDSIKIQEIPIPGNTSPYLRCVRIILPNEKTFKATVRGKLDVSFDTLFEEPSLKAMLLSGLNERTRYTLNIHLNSNADKKIVDARIKDIGTVDKCLRKIVDTVDLISDDEEDTNHYQTIKTDCGDFKFKFTDKELLAKHQPKLSQKCLIVLRRCDKISKKDVLVQSLQKDLVIAEPVISNKSSTEVIEIDDSSEEDVTQEETDIDVLKNRLLKELGVASLLQKETETQQGDNVQSTIQTVTDVQQAILKQPANERPCRTRQSRYHRERDHRTNSTEPIKPLRKRKRSVSCKLPGDKSKIEHDGKFSLRGYRKIIPYDCCITVVNCDHLVEKMQKESKKREDIISNGDVIDCCNETPILLRSGSFSLLNELTALDKPLAVSSGRSTPVIEVTHYSGKNSPVMQAYDLILAEHNKTTVNGISEIPIRLGNNLNCDSDWFETKQNLRMKHYVEKVVTIDQILEEIVQNKLDASTDCETDTATDISIFENENVVTNFYSVPSLKTIMSKYFEDNPIVCQLKHLTRHKDLTKTSLHTRNEIDKVVTIDEIFDEIVQNELDASAASTDISIFEKGNIVNEFCSIPSLKTIMSKYFEDNPIVCSLKHLTRQKDLPKASLNTKNEIKKVVTIDEIFEEIENKLDVSTDRETDAATDISIFEDKNVNNFCSVPSLKSIMSKYFEDNPIVCILKHLTIQKDLPKSSLHTKNEIEKVVTTIKIFEKIVQINSDVSTDCETDAATDISIFKTENVVNDFRSVPSLKSIMSKYFKDNPIVCKLKHLITYKDFPKTPLKRKTVSFNESPSSKVTKITVKSSTSGITSRTEMMQELDDKYKGRDVQDDLLSTDLATFSHIATENILIESHQHTIFQVPETVNHDNLDPDSNRKYSTLLVTEGTPSLNTEMLTDNIKALELKMQTCNESTIHTFPTIGNVLLSSEETNNKLIVETGLDGSESTRPTIQVTEPLNEATDSQENVTASSSTVISKTEYDLNITDINNEILLKKSASVDLITSSTTHIKENTFIDNEMQKNNDAINQNNLDDVPDEMPDLHVEEPLTCVAQKLDKQNSVYGGYSVNQCEIFQHNEKPVEMESGCHKIESNETNIVSLPNTLVSALDEQSTGIQKDIRDACIKTDAVTDKEELGPNLREVSFDNAIPEILSETLCIENPVQKKIVKEPTNKHSLIKQENKTEVHSGVCLDEESKLMQSSEISFKSDQDHSLHEAVVAEKSSENNQEIYLLNDDIIQSNDIETKLVQGEAILKPSEETLCNSSINAHPLETPCAKPELDKEAKDCKINLIQVNLKDELSRNTKEITILTGSSEQQTKNYLDTSKPVLDQTMTDLSESISEKKYSDKYELADGSEQQTNNDLDTSKSVLDQTMKSISIPEIDSVKHETNSSMLHETKLEQSTYYRVILSEKPSTVKRFVDESINKGTNNENIEWSESSVGEEFNTKETILLNSETDIPHTSKIADCISQQQLVNLKELNISSVDSSDTENIAKLHSEKNSCSDIPEKEVGFEVVNAENITSIHDKVAYSCNNTKLVQTDMQDNNNDSSCNLENPGKILENVTSDIFPSTIGAEIQLVDQNIFKANKKTEEICEVDEVQDMKPLEESEEITTQENLNDGYIYVEKTIREVEFDEAILEKNATLVYKDDSGIILKGVEYEDPEIGTCYVFPLAKSSDESGTIEELDTSLESTIEVIQEIEISDMEDSVDSVNLYPESDLKLIEPQVTYSKRCLKRKSNMRDVPCNEKRSKRNSRSRELSEIKVVEKKYRKGKNIDYPKLTDAAIAESGYRKEFKRRLDYYSSVGFSYAITYSTEHIDATELLNKWPISGHLTNKIQEHNEIEYSLFTDLENVEIPTCDPLRQTLAEELAAEYKDNLYPTWFTKEINFNMGFGEGSGRVIQNLDGSTISKFSAATLSDVKQIQPSEKKYDFESSKQEHQSLDRFHTYIKLREKVRSFFKNTTFELTRELNKDKDIMDEDVSAFPFELFIPKHLEPRPIEACVNVVQVGQLPVSAAAQNPVTCDPRVTQVSDASPSQCSVENSPNDDSQPGIKTEYTELTTADLTLPLVDDYVHNQNLSIKSQGTTNISLNSENIPIQTDLIKSEVKIELEEETSEEKEKENNEQFEANNHVNNVEYLYESNNTNTSVESEIQALFSSDKVDTSDQQKTHNGSSEKTDQIAHAMNAAGITTQSETVANTRAQALVNMLSQKIRQSAVATTPNSNNNYPKTASINAMSLQQALAQILPPPLNQTSSTDNNQQGQNTVTPQVLHIVQGKNASGNQITLVDNTQQSVISTPNSTPVLHIVQNKTPSTGPNTNGSPGQQSNSFSGLSLVDAGFQQGGNQLLHIVNTGNQKNSNAGQLLKRVNLLTNLANVQGSNEQKMVQFVCKSADGKAIQLNAPHQRSMVLRLQPIEPTNVQASPPKSVETNQDLSPTQAVTNSLSNKETASAQQEIKSRSVYEENYAKFIQNSSSKPSVLEKSNSLPKFNQAFGKAVFQDGTLKQNDMNSNSMPAVNTNTESNECQSTDNSLNLDHIGQISSPPLLLRKTSAQTTQAPSNLVQQIKQTIAPMNIQTMHGGVIYTRQIPVNIGGGQTINLITVPSTELIDESGQKQQVNQGETIEPSIIKIVPQSQPPPNAEVSPDDINGNSDNPPQHQPVLTQMRIKLPMLSKTPQMVSGTRVVRPSFFQIQRNVIGGANQAVYQQLVLTAAPPLGQQTIRLPQAQTRQIKIPENQSSSESQMSSSTLEQLREFDMVLEQVKERSTVQPNSNSSSGSFKLHTQSTDTTDSPSTANSTPTAETTQVLYSIGSSQPLNVAYVNRKAPISAPTTSTFVRSPDSSGIADSPTSSSHAQLPHTSTSEASSSETTTQHKPVKVSSKSKSRPKSSSNPPNAMKLNTVPPKTSTQKPLEDEQTTQRILYILAEYKEQVENSPDKDKPAPRRRSNPPSNPSGSSKRKKSSSGSRRPGTRDMSPIHGEDTSRTMGSEDSSCGTSQGDCTESCLDSHSPQDSPRKVARKLTFEQEAPATPQPRPQPPRNVIVADGQTITVARGTAGKPATAVLMPANYLLPVSMVKGGQQIAIVTNRGPKLLAVGGGEGGSTNAVLLQRLIGPAGLKPVLARPGVRHVRLPTAALHNLQAFNFATATTVHPPDSTASSASNPTPPDLVESNRSDASPWTDRDSEHKLERASSPDESEPWNLPSSADPHDYTYEETVRTDNMDRTVLDPIPDRYSPDMEAQRIFDKMFDVDTKKSYIVDSQVDSPRCAYDIDASDCDDKPYQVVQKKDCTHRQTRLAHVSAAALRHKYAILEHELRLQKSLSEECEDLGVDSPSASELFPEAELLFAASPAQDHGPDTPHHSHTPQPTLLNQSAIQPDIDDQIATDQLLPRENIPEDRQDLGLGLEDVGIVTVSEDGMQATIALDQEEFARAHPNTTFHSEPTEETVVQPFTISGLKSRHITSTIFHSNRAPATVLMTAPQTTVISQATAETSQNAVKYSDLDNMMHTMPSSHNNISLSSVLVKDDGLTRFDNILTDTRELHLSNTASAIVHPAGNATQVIRRVGYDDNKRERESFLMDEPDALIAGDDAKMIAEDSSRDATLESMGGDVDDGNSSPERHTELFWESNSASERSESRRPLDFSSDSDKCCKSPSYDETNSTDSSGVGTHMRLDSVIKQARGIDRSGSGDGSSADDTHPPLRTYPPKRLYHNTEGEMERSLSGKTRAGERSPDLEVRRRASGRGVVKRGCHCCNGSPAPSRPKKPRQRKPTMDFNT